MKYEQIPPPASLKEHIRYFWVLTSSAAAALPRSFRTIADGCPGLIFQQPDKGIFFQYDKQLPETFLYGQTTRYAELSLQGAFSTIGIFFYPNALRTIFGIKAEELTDTCMDINAIAEKQGFFLSEQLAAASGTAEQIGILSSFLLLQMRKNCGQQDPVMQYALSCVLESKGSIPLKHLHENLQLSERSFERRFKQYTGISPKLFARICRFQASLDQMRNNKYSKLSDIAYENDYSDQSHFIRAFKEFTGSSPFQYQKQSNEIVENLAAVAI